MNTLTINSEVIDYQGELRVIYYRQGYVKIIFNMIQDFDTLDRMKDWWDRHHGTNIIIINKQQPFISGFLDQSKFKENNNMEYQFICTTEKKYVYHPNKWRTDK